ncbi:hypothetical protein L4D00_18330 [Photobacterium swingsii]|uniref:Phosphate ABC transporter substrate-binding protein n=1 Tax=Photobacterium swingsii TaxID=680026 RepID=A0A0J8VF82_9GAMM|nr:hypothetical protein [Photobacterium swingsii]KMV31772.1 hypothetical protein AB733_03025 [Photobacterium swingsii]PSW25386.1 hypothetical protein C9I94_06955 [Photobacterium swingsii]
MNNGLNLKPIVTKLLIASFSLGLSLSAFAKNEAVEDVEFAVFSMNKDIPQLSKSKARMLYKGRTKKLNGSIKIVLVDLPENSIHREEFYDMLLGKSVSQMNGYWASLSFSGKGKPPAELNSDDIKDILEWLNKNPNGIAYAPISTVPENANILITVLQGE